MTKEDKHFIKIISASGAILHDIRNNLVALLYVHYINTSVIVDFVQIFCID